MRRNTLGLPGRRNTNPPARITGTPPLEEEVTPSPLITPPDSSSLKRPGEFVGTNILITPPGSSPLLPTGKEVTTTGLTTPQHSNPPPQVGPKEKELPVETINKPGYRYDKKFEEEDYKRLLKKLDEIQRRGQRPKLREKGPYAHLPPDQIRHVKGGSWNRVMAPDEDFVVKLLEFPRHADDAQPDEFFDHLFKEANAIVTSFVTVNFGGIDIKPEEFGCGHPWNEINVSPLFISLAGLVADADPDDPKGWDMLLYDATERSMMIMGMIARIFIDKVFSPLLFGCTPNQDTMLNALEKEMAENPTLEGFERTKTRSKAIREILDGRVLPINFYDEVEMLSLNIFGLLNPVSAYLEKYLMKYPDSGVTLPTREQQFSSLFDMVTGTAWLSICCRVHPEPIILRTPQLGDKFDKDFDCVNYDEYCEKKARFLKLQYDRLGQEIEHSLDEQEGKSVEDLPDSEILKERAFFVKTAVWPSVKIFSPVYGQGEDPQSGVSEFTIQNCEVGAHWVVPRNDRASIVPTLQEWAKLK
ncbi:hypothetical protein V493_07224 [Pseudogymnoascus sp. VKM F-4281 (FW-2241)]|nr:hypothetical protein V493_07224 [Pseudogymnoascus sp. VKM F-4281 (FW-2241)]